MRNELTILGISGSLRAGSHNTALLRAARMHTPPSIDLEIYDGLRDIPPYDMDLDTPDRRPAAAQDLRDRITEADGLLIATPEFNYSVPGVLKNAIDWVSTDWTGTEGEPLRRKPIAIAGAAPTGFGSVRAQLALRQVFIWPDSDVVAQPELIVHRAHERFDPDGNLVDTTTVKLLRGLLNALAAKMEAYARTRVKAA
ncbi:NADPH-dependent FMN reductase [Actinomadura fibrosa]|uniref:NADPH-dependent FMN reductase n=1 Tax=Actinomadura fibrosa TaxID=111802 RepID=A0ABW2XF55_9ACTN|nr:NADPH-dependent FMN reductase [Actinomadura fibrosa]